MRLRDARWQDIAAMAALEAVCFPHDAWTEATFWAELAQRPRRSYVVAVDEVAVDDVTEDGAGDLADGDAADRAGAALGVQERVTGYAGIDVVGDLADVMTIAVDPARRGGGAGRRLLEELHTRALDAGATSMLLEVRADNAPAHDLYRSRGYAVLHRRTGYYRSVDGTPAVDALVMGKELTTA